MISKIDKYLVNESPTLKDVPKIFMDDPLYKKVLTAKNPEEFKKALDTLLSIRGKDAVKNLQKAMKK